MGVWLLMLVARAGADHSVDRCADRGQRPLLLESFESAILEGRLDEAEQIKQDTIRALSCGAPADRDWLARWWLGEAVLSSLLGEEQPADDALAAAVRASPGVWVDAYGPAFRQRYDTIVSLVQAGDPRFLSEGHVVVAPSPRDEALAVLDGQLVEGLDLQTTSGYHLLQVGPSQSDMRYAGLIYVLPGHDLVVRAQLEILETRPAPPILKRVPALGLTGGVLGIAAATTAIAAVAQNGAMRRASSTEALTSAYKTQRSLAAVSYTCMGGSVLAFGAQIAVTFGEKKP